MQTLRDGCRKSLQRSRKILAEITFQTVFLKPTILHSFHQGDFESVYDQGFGRRKFPTGFVESKNAWMNRFVLVSDPPPHYQHGSEIESR